MFKAIAGFGKRKKNLKTHANTSKYLRNGRRLVRSHRWMDNISRDIMGLGFEETRSERVKDTTGQKTMFVITLGFRARCGPSVS